MAEENKAEVIEKDENVIDVTPDKEPEPELLTKDELKEAGFSKEEIEQAEKLGKIKSEEKEEKKEDPKEEKEPEKPEEKEEKPEPKPEKQEKREFDLSDEEEAEFNRIFNKDNTSHRNVRGLYQNLKEQKRLKQLANDERDQAEKQALELKAKMEELNKRIDEIQNKPTVETDEDGNPIDPDSKPLTKKELMELEKEKQERLTKEQKEMQERQVAIAKAWTRQEENAKSEYDDYDKTVELAKEVMENHEKLFTGKQKSLVQKKIQEFIQAAARADSFGVNDYNPADMAYELGKLNPKYGKPDQQEEVGDKDRNGDRGLTPDEVERIDKNAKKRSSSASLSGSGNRRIVSPEDITLADLNSMTPQKYRQIRQKYPERVKQLLNS